MSVCHTATAFIVNDFGSEKMGAFIVNDSGSEEMGAFIVKWFWESSEKVLINKIAPRF